MYLLSVNLLARMAILVNIGSCYALCVLVGLVKDSFANFQTVCTLNAEVDLFPAQHFAFRKKKNFPLVRRGYFSLSPWQLLSENSLKSTCERGNSLFFLQKGIFTHFKTASALLFCCCCCCSFSSSFFLFLLLLLLFSSNLIDFIHVYSTCTVYAMSVLCVLLL